jgi:hypothetical protein
MAYRGNRQHCGCELGGSRGMGSGCLADADSLSDKDADVAGGFARWDL